jgi:hypothetical protein
MEVDEITVPSPDFPAGLTFGPVRLEDVWEGSVDPERGPADRPDAALSPVLGHPLVS